MKIRADYLEETMEKSTEAKEQTLQSAQRASNASAQPKPRKSNPLIEKLVVIACLLLVAVCLELFVFPLVPQNQIETPTTGKTQTNQNPSVSTQDTKTDIPDSPVTYEIVDYEYYPSDGHIVIIDGEEVDIWTQSGKIYFNRYTEIELHDDHDQEWFNVWF